MVLDEPGDAGGETTMASSPQAQPPAPNTEANVPDPIEAMHIHDEHATAEPPRGKALEVLDACRRADIDELKKLAITQGGFLSDAIRRQAWPVLLGLHDPQHESTELDEKLRTSEDAANAIDEKRGPDQVEDDATSWTKLARHRDEDQVKLDVDRSFIYYPNYQSAQALSLKKAELSDLITCTLRRHPYLCYFQGYHDICQVFLLVLSQHNRYDAVSRLSTLRIRDFMLPNMRPAIAQLHLIPDLLRAADPLLAGHLSQTLQEQPFFALSGTLTMYAHDIESYGDIARLFDALLAREQVFSVYMFAQIILSRRDKLLEMEPDEPDVMQSILSKLPKPLDLESLIQNTVLLFEKHPPERLPTWRRISNASVMKTARDTKTVAMQTIDDGKRFFERQEKELERAEALERARKTLWMYRRPIRGVAVAVLVAVIAVYFRKSSWMSFLPFWPK